MTRALYSFLLRLLLPLALVRLYWRGLESPAYRRRVAERLALGRAGPEAQVWIHAVSVGEVQAAAPLIKRLLTRDPPVRVLVTTTTPTGAERLHERFGESVPHRYTPYDLPGVIDRFLAQTRPSLLIILETEIWPNTLAGCAARGIPVILANARLSERSARGYQRFARLTRETLRRRPVPTRARTSPCWRCIGRCAPVCQTPCSSWCHVIPSASSGLPSW